MNFFELFSATSQHRITVSARFPDYIGTGKPWLNLIRGDLNGVAVPVRFDVVDGTTYPDLIETKNSGLFLISNRMVRILSEKNLTGWSHFPIELVDAADRIVPNFFGLSILGRSGPIDLSKSEIVSKALFPGAPVTRYFKGKHIDARHWDGTDFFLPDGYYGTFLSEKAATAIVSSELSNIEIQNVAEMEVPEATARMLERRRRL